MSTKQTMAGAQAVTTNQPSPVGGEQGFFGKRAKAFFIALFQQTRRDDDCEYIPLGDAGDRFLATTELIMRPCYNHLLPLIHNKLLLDYPPHIAVTGTPGIGKSVFGVILLRHYVLRKETVVYFERDSIYVFSFDPVVVPLFGLSAFVQVKGSTCYAGYWDTESSPHYVHLLTSPHVNNGVVIHDPKMGDDRVCNRAHGIERLVYILSHGHSLISYWNDKGNAPIYYYLPLWSEEEAKSCSRHLKIQGNPSSPPLQKEQVEELYHRFGGCIRGWVVRDPVSFQQNLHAKVLDVVKNNGDNILVKNTSVRGSIIHLRVDFDENRPIVTFDGDGNDHDEMFVDEAAAHSERNRADMGATGSQVGENEPNNFTDFDYIFGSEATLNEFNDALLDRSDDALRLCVNQWNSPDAGFECVYGALFELRCHRKFENEMKGLKLRMRIVFNPKKKKPNEEDTVSDKWVTLPVFDRTIRYRSNDPSILSEDPNIGPIKKNQYLLPYSSNHPSYDAAVVVDSAALGLPSRCKCAGLLLQMTVSGATQLPRRPEHCVKRHIRLKFDKVFKDSNGIPDYKGNEGEAFTSFVVPTECFKPFQFQEESDMEGKLVSDRNQPRFQLVFEMPDQFTYKRVSPKQRAKMQDNYYSKKRKYYKYNTSVALADS